MSMTREIKFRAWDKDNLEMCEMFWVGSLQGMVRNVIQQDKNGEWVTLGKPLVNYELMQYTGLVDKAGKEIYEGDVIKCCDGKIYKITFPSMGFGFCMDWYDNERKVGTRQLIGDYYNSVVHSGPSKSTTPDGKSTGDEWEQEHTPQVIGNIYENPELLKGA